MPMPIKEWSSIDLHKKIIFNKFFFLLFKLIYLQKKRKQNKFLKFLKKAKFEQICKTVAKPAINQSQLFLIRKLAPKISY